MMNSPTTTMTESYGAPIFIGGPDRCGKTTMRSFLVSHPNISIPLVGSNLWSYFYNQYGSLSKPENFERCLEAMLRYKHIAFLKPDPVRLWREFYQGEPTYPRLFALIQMHHAEREGKPRWGDQTGLVERYADQIFEAYPDAKIIHMLRDPRDRYEASITRFPEGKGRAGAAAARWLYSAWHAERNMERYPRDYKLVTLESLIRDTENVLQDVCEFLGESFESEMLDMPGAPEFRKRLVKGRSENPPEGLLLEKFIGTYREVLTDEEIAFLQRLARKQMKVLGYTIETLELPLASRLRYLFIDFPLNLGRMGAWLGRELLQQNFPAVFKRRPGTHMKVKLRSEAEKPDEDPVHFPWSVESVRMPEPLFIGGASRSGKTYMRFMLDSHPNLAISRRTRLWPQFFNRYGDLSKDENLDRCLHDLEKRKHVRLLLPDMDRIRRLFRSGAPTYPRLFALLHEEYARKLDKQRWGDQTELLERFAPVILASYPGAKFIHMIRDPRDRFEAILDRNPGSLRRLGIETARWKYSCTLATRNRKRFPEQYKIVRYEDMVNDPAGVMQDICEFVGEPYDENMIQMRNVPRFDPVRSENGRPTPLSDKFIGRYRSRLNPGQIDFIQNAAGNLMEQAGYPTEDFQLNPPEKLGYFTLVRPAHQLQMAAGLAFENLSTYRRVTRHTP